MPPRKWKKHKATSIEKKIEKFLKELGVVYKKEYRIECFPVDFFIPKYKVVIQADGCYWHFCNCECNEGKKPTPVQKKQMYSDAACNKILKGLQYKVIRLKECEINNDWDRCKNRIKRLLRKRN